MLRVYVHISLRKWLCVYLDRTERKKQKEKELPASERQTQRLLLVFLWEARC